VSCIKFEIFFFECPTNGAKRKNDSDAAVVHSHSLTLRSGKRSDKGGQNERTRDTHSPVGAKLEHTLVTRGQTGRKNQSMKGREGKGREGKEGKRGRVSWPGDAVISKPNMYSRPKKPSKRESYLVKYQPNFGLRYAHHPVLSPWFRSRESQGPPQRRSGRARRFPVQVGFKAS
jgi:hypothetical protein